MAIGDKAQGLSSVAAAGYLAIQPASGTEWTIHNLYWGGDVEIYFYDGTNSIKIDSDTANGARLGCVFNCTNSKYIRLKNTSAGAAYYGYDGVITKTT